jgi:hypothetical protein
LIDWAFALLGLWVTVQYWTVPVRLKRKKLVVWETARCQSQGLAQIVLSMKPLANRTTVQGAGSSRT